MPTTYTHSAAQTGAGSSLSIGATPTLIGEIKSCELSGTWETVDVSNFQSSVNREFIATMRDNGTCKLSGNRVSADAGQLLVEAGYASGLLQSFTLVIDKTPAQVTTGDTYTFSALIMERAFTVAVDKEVDYQITLKISGAVGFVEGE